MGSWGGGRLILRPLRQQVWWSHFKDWSPVCQMGRKLLETRRCGGGGCWGEGLYSLSKNDKEKPLRWVKSWRYMTHSRTNPEKHLPPEHIQCGQRRDTLASPSTRDIHSGWWRHSTTCLCWSLQKKKKERKKVALLSLLADIAKC